MDVGVSGMNLPHPRGYIFGSADVKIVTKWEEYTLIFRWHDRMIGFRWGDKVFVNCGDE